MGVLIVHGWQNHRPAGHWQRELAERLTADGHRVRYPQFPEPDVPVPEDWLALLRSELAAFAPPGIETTPLPDDLRARVRLVASDDDPYFPGGAAALYADRFGLEADVVPGGQHLDLPAGYGSWPSVHAWCTDASVRITGR